MKVLVIPSWLPFGEDKLMGIYHKDFTEALNEHKNIKANILFLYRQRLKNPLKYLFNEKEEIIKEKNYNIYINKVLNLKSINYKLNLYYYTKKLEKSYLKYEEIFGKPDIIHAHVTLPAGYASAKLGKKYDIPVLITEHFSKFNSFFEGKNNKYAMYALKNSTYSTVSNYMTEKVGTDCKVIPNLVDTSEFFSSKNKNNTLKLVSVSALRPGKYIDVTLKAIKILIDKYNIKDISFDIVGDGELMEEYKKLTTELNLNNYVTFLGRKNIKKDIAKILSNKSILIISSDKETFSIPGIEALASGIPIVSTRCKGPEEYIDDKCGVLCNVNDPEDMAKAIIKCSKTEYNINYLKSIAKKYDKKVVIENVYKIYKDMLKGK